MSTGRRARTSTLVLAAILVAAGLFRIGYVAVAKSGEDVVGDQIYYSAQAHAIADGRWFEHPYRQGVEAADHPPLTALVLAPVSVGDDPVMAQRYTMALLGVLAVALVALVAGRVAGRRAQVVAAVIAAAYGAFWLNDGLVMSETISTVCLALALLAAYRYHRRRDPAAAALLGAAIGLTALARAEALLLVVLVALPMAVLPRWGAPAARRDRLRHAGAAAGACVLVLAPWTVYNLTRFERPVLLSTNDGLTIAGTNCDQVWRGGGIGFWSLECALAVPVPDDADQSEESAILREAGVEYLTDHLGDLPRVVVARLGRVWGVWRIDQMSWLNQGEGREHSLSNLAAVQFLVLAPLAAWGGVVLARRRAFLLPLLAMPVIVTVVAAAFYGIVRFRLPADIAAVVLAAAGIDDLIERGRHRWRSQTRGLADEVHVLISVRRVRRG